MKKLLSILFFCLFAASLQAQVLQEPTIFGTLYKNLGAKTSLIYPTVCGTPTLTPAISVYKQSALCYDSCGHKFYVYDPSDSAWSALGSADLTNYFTKSQIDSIAGLKVDSVTVNADSTQLIYWKNGTGTTFFNTTTGLTGGDTTVFETVVDSTGQPGQRVLWSANNKIKSDQYFIYDSARHKLVIGNKNISIGGPNTKFYLVGNAIINGNITAAKHITQGGTSNDFVKGDGTLDGSTYRKTTDSLNTTFLTGPKIDSALLPKQNFLFTYPLYAVNDTTAGLRNDSMSLLTYGAGVDTSLISGRKIPTADWVLARVGSGGGGGSVTGLYQKITATAGQTAFTFTLIPTDANKVGFYINGSFISQSFYSISGNTVTFTSGLQLNDVLEEQGVQ